MILTLIDKATTAGARLKKAATLLGLSDRTILRWRQSDTDDDKRNGPASVPANKLSKQERMQIIDVANSAPYRDMSPKQIVPNLADQGVYIGSESSFYRVLKEQKMINHRQRSKPATGPCQVWAKMGTFYVFMLFYLCLPIELFYILF